MRLIPICAILCASLAVAGCNTTAIFGGGIPCELPTAQQRTYSRLDTEATREHIIIDNAVRAELCPQPAV